MGCLDGRDQGVFGWRTDGIKSDATPGSDAKGDVERKRTMAAYQELKRGCGECGARLYISDSYRGNEIAEMTLTCSEGHVWIAQAFGSIGSTAEFHRSPLAEMAYRAERERVA